MSHCEVDTSLLELRFPWIFTTDRVAGDLSAASLLEPTALDELLHMWQQRIGTREQSVAASMLAKRYAAVLLPGWLFAFSRLERVIPVSPDQWALRFGDGWDVALVLPSAQTCPVEGKRDDWRQQAIASLFRDHLTPVFSAFSRYLSPAVLWESVRSYLYYHYESWQTETVGTEEEQRLREDIQFLTQRNNPWITGMTPNPLSIPFRVVSAVEGGDPVRLRRTCCLYYRLPGAQCCANCPRRRNRTSTPTAAIPLTAEDGS